jgi:membrane protein YqaA with SNARE-associated domain
LCIASSSKMASQRGSIPTYVLGVGMTRFIKPRQTRDRQTVHDIEVELW